MLVKQIYVGWTGVKLDGWCANATTNFKVESVGMNKQLVGYTPTKQDEIDTLYDGISKQDDFPQKASMLEYLKKLKSRR